ncbi:hypothetical protein [Neobacillus vireti]|uniref:hypothetical protein n=1 Tax=Neobacillus vireti TaxID=220686 RepID=UPI002FFEAA79
MKREKRSKNGKGWKYLIDCLWLVCGIGLEEMTKPAYFMSELFIMIRKINIEVER